MTDGDAAPPGEPEAPTAADGDDAATVGGLAGGVAAVASGVRFGQFLSVGAVGAAFDVTTTLALTKGLAVQPDLAKFLGAEVAIVVMFLANEHWTFAEHGTTGLAPTLKRLLTSNLVRSGGLAVQLAVFWVVRRQPVSIRVAGLELWDVLPILIAIGTAATVNFVAESLLTWRVHRTGEA